MKRRKKEYTFASRLGMGVRRFDGLVWLNSAAIGAPNTTRRGVSSPISGTVILTPPPAAAAGRADGDRGSLTTLSAIAVRSGES